MGVGIECLTMAGFGIAGAYGEKEKDFQSISLDYSEAEYSANHEQYFLQRILPMVAPNINQEESNHVFEIGHLHDPHFIDLSSLYANIQWRVVHADGTMLSNTEKEVSVVNNFSHAMIQHIDVSINNQGISDHARHTAFRSYATNLLTLAGDVKKDFLKFDYFIDDELGTNIDIIPGSFDPNTGEKGLIERNGVIAESKTLYSYFRPHFDLQSSQRDIPGDLIYIDFNRH